MQIRFLKNENINQFIHYLHYKNENNLFKWPYKQGKIIKNYKGDIRIWVLASAILKILKDKNLNKKLKKLKQFYPCFVMEVHL